MKIAIAGATGLTGNLCLKELIENEKITEIYAIGRRPTGIAHSKINEVKLENNKLTQKVNADAFICCLGTTIKKAGSKKAFEQIDLELPLYLAMELKSAGCKTAAVISSLGADPKSMIFYSRVKGKMESAMKEIGFESLSILRPSLIRGNRNEKRFGEDFAKVMMKLFDLILIGPMKNYQSIQAKDIAKSLVKKVIEGIPGFHIYKSGRI